jgi:predicted nucleic acid-binding protein
MNAKKFLEQIRKGKKLSIITDFTIHSIIVIMYNYGELEGLKIFLSSLTGYKGLRIYPTDLTNEIKAVELAKQYKLDEDDAIQYAIALDANVEAIVSFDKHFTKLEIPRLEPQQLI